MLFNAIFILGFPLKVICSRIDHSSLKPSFDVDIKFYTDSSTPVDPRNISAFEKMVHEYEQWNELEMRDKNDSSTPVDPRNISAFEKMVHGYEQWNELEMRDKNDSSTPVDPRNISAFEKMVHEYEQWWNELEMRDKNENLTKSKLIEFKIDWWSGFNGGPLEVFELKMPELKIIAKANLTKSKLIEFKIEWSSGINGGPLEVFELKMPELKIIAKDYDQLFWNGLKEFDEKELNYQISMESMNEIDSAALFAFVSIFVTVLSMRRVSEEKLIKDTVTNSPIVKTATKEARQKLPTKVEEEALYYDTVTNSPIVKTATKEARQKLPLKVEEEALYYDTVSNSPIVKTATKEARQKLPTKVEEEAVRHCELCINHDQAIAYCTTCKLYICMPCNGLHKRVWTLMNHTVCPLNHM